MRWRPRGRSAPEAIASAVSSISASKTRVRSCSASPSWVSFSVRPGTQGDLFQTSGPHGKAPGGAEEQAEQAWMDGENGYRSALLSTLGRTRELLAQGRL